MVNRKVEATFYSLVGTSDGVALVARWHDDLETGATCWIEIDRESRVASEDANAAWDRISRRNQRLLRGA